MNVMLLVSAALMGLLGGAHCVLMCGGVVAMSCSALPLDRRSRPIAQMPYILAYNAGRIVSYAAAGAIAGALGSMFVRLAPVTRLQLGLRLAAGVTMVLVGLYVAGFGAALRWIERAGVPLWRHIVPLARRFVPVRSPMHALALGLLWGWMPCGLVYAALASSLTAGSSLGGAATMAAFGMGTLPALITMGSCAAVVARAARAPIVRWVAGATMLAFGMIQLLVVGRAWPYVSSRDVAVVSMCHGHVGRQ
jgi:sulfite exporter TauE/SafE